MLRYVKIRLYPTESQALLIDKNIGCARFVYNHMLAIRIQRWEDSKQATSMFELDKMLPKLKQEFEWLKEADSTSLQQAIKDMDEAYQRFFKTGNGFPKFKKKQDGYGSFRCTMSLQTSGNRLKCGKHSNLLFRCSKASKEKLSAHKIKRIVIMKDAGKYFASCLIDLPEPSECDPNYGTFKFSACGVDLGVKIPVALAYRKDGRRIGYSKAGSTYTRDLINKECRRIRYQRRLARKVKGSNNFKKCKSRLQKAFLEERNFRNHFIETVSHRLASNFALISFEDLNLKSMTKAVKKKEDGSARKNVEAKSGLNRSMLRNGMSALRIRTEQKALQRGGQFVAVDPKFTSQICSQCGYKDKKNRKSQAKFKCLCCGYSKNADYNAARNILKRAEH